MAKELTWWPSPAKLNLFLHITGKLENGYHSLQSLFQILDFGDELAFEISPTQHIELLTPIPGVDNHDNLIIKAALLLQQHAKVSIGCNIRINKRLPMGGGIGGGSSNAATTLVALNHYWKAGLTIQQLCELGLTLGADVPIFVKGNTAFAEGIGEQIYPVELEQKYYLVVFPNCHVSTAEIFQAKDLPRNTAKIDWQNYRFEDTHNDCEKLVCNRYPKVANLLHWLVEYAPSRMTGTGACLFAVFDSAEKACLLKEQLPEDCIGFVTQGVNRSGLLKQLDALNKIDN